MKNRWKLTLLALLALVLVYLHRNYHVPLESVLPWQPDNLLLGAVVILLLLIDYLTLHESNAAKSESRNRILNMVPGTETYFEKLLAQQKKAHELMGKEFAPQIHVCAWPGGKPFSPDYASHQFKNALAKAAYHPFAFMICVIRQEVCCWRTVLVLRRFRSILATVKLQQPYINTYTVSPEAEKLPRIPWFSCSNSSAC